MSTKKPVKFVTPLLASRFKISRLSHYSFCLLLECYQLLELVKCFSFTMFFYVANKLLIKIPTAAVFYLVTASSWQVILSENWQQRTTLCIIKSVGLVTRTEIRVSLWTARTCLREIVCIFHLPRAYLPTTVFRREALYSEFYLIYHDD